MRRLLLVAAAVAVLGGAALLVQRGSARAGGPPTRECPSVSTLSGFKHGRAIRSFAQNMSCAEALGIVRAMVSGVGVTFVGNPEGAADQFRWKLYGFPGWTCYGDGSGFPEGGAGGDCSKGSASVGWYHALSR